MKKPGEHLKKGLSGRGLIVAAFIAQFPLFSPLATAVAAASEAGVTTANSPQAAATVQFSAGIGEILKMVDAKVDAAVIQAYIKNSSVAYNPSASEIIALRGRGVNDDLLTALLERGAEIHAMQGNARAGSPAPSAPYRTAPGYGTEPAYPYAAAPEYTYDYPSYYYPDSYSYWGAYGYPWFWGSSFAFDFCPFQPFGFCSFHHRFHHFNGSHFGRFDGHTHGFGPGRFGHGNFGSHAFANQPFRSANPNMTFHASALTGRSQMGGFRSAGPNTTFHASAMSGRTLSMPGRSGGFRSGPVAGFRSGGGGFHGGGGSHGGRGR